MIGVFHDVRFLKKKFPATRVSGAGGGPGGGVFSLVRLVVPCGKKFAARFAVFISQPGSKPRACILCVTMSETIEYVR